MNTIRCRDCKNYDPLTRGKNKNSSHGWCALKSIYPAKEGPGQLFPPGVKRMESPELPAKPLIVTGDATMVHCAVATPKAKRAS